MKKSKILLVMLGAILVLAAGAFSFLFFTHYPATADVFAIIAEDSSAVIKNDLVEFWPQLQEPEVGFIIYPGGNVDFRAYAPLAADISKQGYYTAVVRMPFSLAVFNQNRADDVIDRYPLIKHWVIAGHSLGGVMAARYALDNEDIKGLVLWASYPDKDLTSTNLKVISLFATKDGVLNKDSYEKAKPYLPKDTVFQPIFGGNHSYFGSYGFQRGDLEADITREEQQKQIVEATLLFLESVNQ